MVNPGADKIKSKVAFFLLACFFTTATADIFGSRASFLLMDTEGMSLSYLSQNVDDAWRTRMENSLLANGDTHIYLYSQNEADDVGNISPYPDWEQRLDHLNRRGLRPIMWLMADDSPSLAALPLSTHKAHNAEMVRRLDSKVDGYVIGLEVDEYWTAAQTNELIQDLKQHTNKPIGVHLTPTTPLEYVTHADVLYLQTGFGLTQEQFREKVKATLLATSKPVIVSEYSLQSDTAYARALGDIACEMGAAGTGNGRSVDFCGQREQKKIHWYKKYETEMVVAGITMVALYAVTRYDLPLQLRATEDGYQIGAVKKITKNQSIGLNYRDDGTVIAHYRIEF
jgi:hypothetical protein